MAKQEAKEAAVMVIVKIDFKERFITSAAMRNLERYIGKEVVVTEISHGKNEITRGILCNVHPFGNVVVNNVGLPFIGLFGAIEEIRCGQQCIYKNTTLMPDYPVFPRGDLTIKIQEILSFGPDAGKFR